MSTELNFEPQAAYRPEDGWHSDALAQELPGEAPGDPEPGGPWDAQSDIVKELVDARDKLWMSALLSSNYNADHPDHAKLDRQIYDLDEKLVAQQRAHARPYFYRFEILKVAQ